MTPRPRFSPWWLAGWAALLAAPLAFELYSLADHTSATPPLTQVIGRYIPAVGFFASLTVTFLVLVWHFVVTYRRRP